MIDRSTPPKWLAEEVWELFQAGPVGLYEFIEILNSDYRPPEARGLSEPDKRVVARAALDELMARGGYELRWQVWASNYDEPATLATMTNESWEPPTEAPYLVIAERHDSP